MSKEADEIAKRIFDACSPESRFHRDMVTAMHKAELKTGDGYEIISSSVADELIKLGYVKVVRCGECKAWCLDGDQSNMVDDDGKDRRYCIIRRGYMGVDDYCSAGEPKANTMLEKLAEMVREEALNAMDCAGELLPCFACDRRPRRSENCEKRVGCPEPHEPEGSLMLARWAVLLVAKALKKELTGVENAWDDFYEAHDKGDDEGLKKAEAHYLAACRECATELLHLVAVAEPANVSSVEEQMCQAKEDTNDAV